MKDIHAFGCPVFALQSALAGGGTLPHWSPRARLGLNLGQSPSHARNVNLVLSLSTGLVSPQYHCTYDDFFETTKYGVPETSISGIWQQLAGLTRATQVPTVEHRVTTSIVSPPSSFSDRQSPSSRTPSSNTYSEDYTEHSSSFEHDFIFDPSDSVEIPATAEQEPNPAQHSHPAPDVAPINGGISSRGRQRTLSRAMQDSIAQKNFYSHRGMHYMAVTAMTRTMTRMMTAWTTMPSTIGIWTFKIA